MAIIAIDGNISYSATSDSRRLKADVPIAILNPARVVAEASSKQ